MKYFFSAAALFLASLAFAAPKVGDQAIYDLAEGTQTAQNQRTVLAADIANNACQEQWQIVGDDSSISQDAVKCTDIDFSPYTEAHCAQAHGVMKQVTVPAGTFMACEIQTGKGGFVDISAVPFGLVYANLIDDSGATETVQLHSYRSVGVK